MNRGARAPFAEALLLLGLIAAIFILRRRSVAAEAEVYVQPGERLRLIAMEWLEPLIAVVVVAIVLRDELSQGASHWIAAAIGAVLGVAFGVYRARIIYVRSEPCYKAVVLRRTGIGYAALAILLGLNFFAEYATQTNEWLSLLVTAALTLIVVESCARVAWTTRQYNKAKSDLIETR